MKQMPSMPVSSSWSVLANKEREAMSETKNASLALNVRLKSSDSSAPPRVANNTNVAVSQGSAYLGFGFIEPARLAVSAKTAKDSQAVPKGLDGYLVTLVAMDVSMLMPLQQIQQFVVGLRAVRRTQGPETKSKTNGGLFTDRGCMTVGECLRLFLIRGHRLR